MMRITYVHNVMMPYKAPLMSRLGSADETVVTAVSSRSHWPSSKLHGHMRQGGRHFDLKTCPTLDLSLNYRGRQAHVFLSPTIPFEVAKSRPDVLVLGISNVFNNALLRRWAARGEIPYVWHGIGSMYSERSFLRSVVDREVRQLLEGASAGIAFNEAARDYYVDAYGVDPDAVRVIPNVVDTDRVVRAVPRRGQDRSIDLGAEPKVWKLRYVGALQAAKRVDRLVAASALLRRRGRSVELRIAGDGPERARLAAQLRSEGWNPDEVLVGRLDFDAAACFLSRAHLAVLPGLGGLGVTHALASGTPVICAPGDGSAGDQIVHGVNGLVMEDATPVGISHGVERLMADGAWRRDAWFDDRVRSHTRMLEIDRVAASFAAVLGGVVNAV